jgi:hypothetical protein
MSAFVDSNPVRPTVPTRPNLRPIALPTEHGGWGFLFEPLILGLIVVPSWAGALLAIATVFAFLTRQPLRFALQDRIRGKSYPRTSYCWRFAAMYGAGALVAAAGAIALAGWWLAVPILIAAPLGIVQLVHDARNHSRRLLPELAGATAMMCSAAAIAIAGGSSWALASMLAGAMLARTLPSIVYVRTLVMRSHGVAASPWPAIAIHVVATIAVASFAPAVAIVAMLILLTRATRGLSIPPPRAQTLGWREIAFGALTVTLLAIAFA